MRRAAPTWPICDEILTIEPGSFATDQPQRHRLRHEERGAHIERENGVEVLDLDVRQMRRPVHAGIVDEDLKRFGRGDRLSRGLDVGDIEHQRVGLLAAGADGARRILDFLLGARGECHMRAGRGQRRRRRKPDAAATAGDERALAVEPERCSLAKLNRRHGGYAFPFA